MVRERGYSLMEMVVAMAVFGVFLIILTMLTAEMRQYEARLPVNFMRHPQITAVMSRLRQDVHDAWLTNPYPEEFEEYEQGPNLLIVQGMRGGGLQTIIWDFREPGIVKRISYNVGIATTWTARGVPPDFKVQLEAVDVGASEWGTRVMARDRNGRISIDQILQPRAHN